MRADRDLRAAVETSTTRWGTDAGTRYARLLQAAVDAIAAAPEGPLTKLHAGLGVRSIHTRLVRTGIGVRDPVHVVYYRLSTAKLEIVRVLHERMDPHRHIGKRKAR